MFSNFSLAALMESRYFIAAIVAVSLLATEYANMRKNAHYNRSSASTSVLNRKFRFDKKRTLDIAEVNRTIALCNVAVILIGCAVITYNVRTGVFTLLALYVIANVAVCYYLGWKYRDTH